MCSFESKHQDDYMKMKEAVFKEYGLSAKCFLEKFHQVRKGASDTFVLYGSKLEGILKQYLPKISRGSPGIRWMNFGLQRAKMLG